MNREEMLKHWAGGIGGVTAQLMDKPGSNPEHSTAGGLPFRLAPSPETSQKTVLLVDSNDRSRKLRAKAMLALRVRMDCVANVEAARTRLATEKYNLILVDLSDDSDAAEALVQEIRARDSRQLVRFLVGSPMFLAESPGSRKPDAVGEPTSSQMLDSPAEARPGKSEDQDGEVETP